MRIPFGSLMMIFKPCTGECICPGKVDTHPAISTSGVY